jgi:hypothetical protein
MIYLLDFRAANTGGPVVPGKLVAAPGLGTEMDLRAETNLTFIVHGYNVDRDSGRESLTKAAQQLMTGHPVSYVGVLWPGDHWVRALSYPFEGRDADDSAAFLVRYIQDVIPRGSRLSFVSHSLGARVLFATVKRLRPDYSIGQVVAMAPAVDDTCVATPGDYLPAVVRSERVAVLASKKDRVLQLAYPVGDVLQAFIFFRTDHPGLALGYHGPRAAKGHAIPGQVFHEQIPDGRDSDHSHYLPTPKPTQTEARNQASALNFARNALQGAPRPRYE